MTLLARIGESKLLWFKMGDENEWFIYVGFGLGSF